MGIFSKLKDQLSQIQQENRENASEKTAPKEIFDRMREKLEDLQKTQQTKKGRTREGSIFGQLKDKLEQAQKENQVTPTEETADASILDRIQAEVEKLEKQKEPIEIETKPIERPMWGSPAGVPTADSILDRVISATKEESAPKKPSKEEEFGSIFDKIMSSDKPKTTTPKAAPVVYEEVKTKHTTSASVAKNTSLYVGGSALVDGKGGSLALRSAPNMGASQNQQRLPDNVNVRLLDYTDQNAINIDGVTSGWYKIDYNGQQGWLLSSYLE